MPLFRLMIALLFWLPLAARAECIGQNLIDALPAADRDALYAAAHAQPYATGNFWQATRGADQLYLAGTFHLDDARHDALLAQLIPLLEQAKTLLVEAGPKEEAALQQRLATDPAAMMQMEGSGLETALPAEDWEKLTAALLQRGIPASIARTLRPWFVSMMLSIPPCAMQMAAKGGGLDKRLIQTAEAKGIAVEALEPFDTALEMFDGLNKEEQLSMIRNALSVEDNADDMLATTADAYFAGESRLIWEFSRLIASRVPGATPAQTDADFAQAEELMMAARNRNWMTAIEAALKNGPTFAAFGALHLSGREGVLELLKARGFTVTPLNLAR